ncbi:hypothetical protein AK830_g4086 [Neonectria ditissima]|uniref:Uncharacterized protein n=1 Tax=Neonectria ditissima TaxID=78410 RepID=A0A0P7BNT0_9HYPO|nr:hypothetical protein AK830_g4086 [Neonectria ditissima]
MATPRAQTNCAGIIASLEGRNRVNLPEDLVSGSSLAGLSTRVRRLEALHGITLPPASLDPTWDSLALRVCRVQQLTQAKSPKLRSADNSFAAMVPDSLDVATETLQTLCSDLCRPRSPHLPMAAAMSWPKCASDEEMLDVIRQRMCYSAGLNRILVTSVPITRIEMYAQIVGLTLKLEEPEPNAGIPGAIGPRGHPHVMKKACCGCCLCYCHNALPPRRPPVLPKHRKRSLSSIINVRPQRRKKTSGFGWVKKLAFWRRSKHDDDWSSTTSSRSSTVVDP